MTRRLTIADNLLLQFGQTVLETHRLKPCECCTNPEIERNSNLDGLCLTHVELDGVPARIMDLPVWTVEREPPEHNVRAHATLTLQ